MVHYIPEIFEEINADPSKLQKYLDNYAVTSLLKYAFDRNLKMLLPEGTPPYKPDAAPLGMSPTTLYNQVKKLYIFMREDLSKVRREQLFIQLLESIHPKEAEIMVAVKDQNLTSMYKNITVDLVTKAGLVKEQDTFRPVMVQQETTEGKELVLNLSDSAATKESFGPAPTEADTSKVENVPKKRGRKPKS